MKHQNPISSPLDCAAVRKAQRGSALIMGLIMLLVITMIGLTAMQTTTQQERMAGNLRDRNIAFQAAESALRRGEEALLNRCIEGEDFDNTRDYDVESNTDPEKRAFVENAATLDDEWSDEHSRRFDDFNEVCTEATDHSSLVQSADAPRYFVERQPPVAGPSLEAGVAKTIEAFKVTSRGVGGSDAAVVVLQSGVKRD